MLSSAESRSVDGGFRLRGNATGLTGNGMSRFCRRRRLYPMKKAAQHLIAEVPRRQPRVTMTIGIDLGDVWSHHCTLNQGGEVVDRGRFRTNPKDREKLFMRE